MLKGPKLLERSAGPGGRIVGADRVALPSVARRAPEDLQAVDGLAARDAPGKLFEIRLAAFHPELSDGAYAPGMAPKTVLSARAALAHAAVQVLVEELLHHPAVGMGRTGGGERHP